MLKIIDEIENNIKHEVQRHKQGASLRFGNYRTTKNLAYLSEAKYYLRQYKEYLKKLDKHIKKRIMISPEKIIELLDLYFKDQWDSEENNIYIHYPRVIVTDNNGKTHEVTDVYLRIKLGGHVPDGIHVAARRMSATPEEILNSYCHSHISYTGLRGFTNSVCFGRDFKWQNDDYLLSLEHLLVHFKSFLETESSNTSPYALLGNIKTLHNEYTEYDIKYNFETIPFDIDIVYLQGLPIFQPRNNERLNEYLINTYNEALAYEKDGKYYISQSNITGVETHTQDNIFIFKGAEVEFKILPSKEKIIEKTFNNHFKNYFIYNASIEITKIITSFTATKPKHPVDNIGVVVQEDTISLLRD